MGKEKRRAPRIEGNLPVTLLLRDEQEDLPLSDPLPAQILDISTYGARLNVTRVRVGDYHLFYSFNDSPQHFLDICLEGPGPDKKTITVPAYPVWFDHLVSVPGQPFQLGMEFLIDPHDQNVRSLVEIFRETNRKKGWLKTLFGK